MRKKFAIGAGLLLLFFLLVAYGSVVKGVRGDLSKGRRTRVDIRSGENVDFLLEIAGDHSVWVDQELARVRIREYRRGWERYDQLVVSSLQDQVGLDFAEGSIEVYLLNRGAMAISRPILVPLGAVPNRESFVATLIHELIHRLFTDNPQIDSDAIAREMFPGEERKLVRRHVIVFAFLRNLVRDVLREPHLLEVQQTIDEEGGGDQNQYRAAWKEVDRQGSAHIIRDFKRHIRKNRGVEQGGG